MLVLKEIFVPLQRNLGTRTSSSANRADVDVRAPSIKVYYVWA